MRVKSNHVIIPALAFLVLWLGKFYASAGLTWYRTLKLPSETPSELVFPIIWFVIFLGVINTGLIVWNYFYRDMLFYAAILLFLVNGVLNVLWTKLFFYQHEIQYALFDAIALEATIVLLLFYIFPRSRIAALSLLPYTLWVAFAIYLNYQILLLN